ncbi:MAG: LysR family transcriptional regulator [Eubacteriales bacterium]
MPQEIKLFPLITVRVKRERAVIGPGMLTLLQAIDRQNSVRQGAEEMGVSYSKAWTMIRTAEQELSTQLVDRQSGGATGGSATLTDAARALCKQYIQFNQEIQSYANQIFDQYFTQEQINLPNQKENVT